MTEHILKREEGFFRRIIREYPVIGNAFALKEGPSVKKMFTNSSFVYELCDSETLRGSFALNPPSMKVWLYFLVGIVVGTIILSKIVAAIHL
jgi:hypothetical protein